MTKRFLPYTEEWTDEDESNMQSLWDTGAYKSLCRGLRNAMAEKNALLVNELAEGKEDRHSPAILVLDDTLRWLEGFEPKEEVEEEPVKEVRLGDKIP